MFIQVWDRQTKSIIHNSFLINISLARLASLLPSSSQWWPSTTMMTIVVNEDHDSDRHGGHGLQVWCWMGSTWWEHCATNSRPAPSVIPSWHFSRLPPAHPWPPPLPPSHLTSAPLDRQAQCMGLCVCCQVPTICKTLVNTFWGQSQIFPAATVQCLSPIQLNRLKVSWLSSASAGNPTFEQDQNSHHCH